MATNKQINWKNLGEQKVKTKREWSSLDTASEAIDLMITGVVSIGSGMLNCAMAIFYVIAFAFATAFDGLSGLMKSKSKKKR